MKVRNQGSIRSTPGLTAEEHLWVQREIEKRAYELWRIGGRRQIGALNDWLQAEQEILQEFVQSRINQLQFQHNSGRAKPLLTSQSKRTQ